MTYLGRLYSWGYNSKHNVLGRDCDQKFSLTPGLVPSLMMMKIRQVSCGHNFTLVCTKQGETYSWGCGRYGTLGHGTEECQLHPKKIDALNAINVKNVAAGYAHCAVITDDGRAYVFGKGCDGALGLGTDDVSNRSEPVWLQSLISFEIEQISCSKGEHRGHTVEIL